MRIILLGAPGSGKGTQSEMLREKYGTCSISTGEILRQAIDEETELGLKAKVYINDGKLVPDNVVIEIVGNRIKECDCENGYILDGFPRTVNQAKEFDKILREEGQKLDYVFNFLVEEEEIVKRLSGRRQCRDCKTGYHVEFSPSKVEGVCDKCRGELFQREDDEEKTIQKRLKVYHKETKPLVDYYKKAGILVDLVGTGDSQKIFRHLVVECDKIDA